MGTVVTFTEEFSSPVAARKLYNALILDSDNLLPNLIPQSIKSIQTIQGHGGPGTIKLMTVAQGEETKNLKHRIDALDKEKMIYSYTLIEGGELTDQIEAIGYEMKLEATPEGGCKGTNVCKYYLKGGGGEIKEEEIKGGRGKATAVFKAVEAFLIANPGTYE